MKVNNNRDISFKGFYNNKVLKKGLEFAADNGTLLAATTTLGFSAVVRPIAIWVAPHTDKENKKIACAKSLASSTTGYLLTLGLTLPFTKALKKIDKFPKKYLKEDTIKNLSNGLDKLEKSKSYNLATQTFKLGLGVVIAVPKAILTCLGMPYVMKAIFNKPIPNKIKEKKENNLSFKGKGEEKLAKNIGKIIDTKHMQKFANKYKDSNFPMHIIALTDTLTTATFIHQVDRSKKIEEKRKKALIYNAGISTSLCIISSYIVDKLLDKPTEKFIQKFKNANKGLPNLEKQVQGIKIAKPILILGCVYYILIPLISTVLADIAERNPKLDIHKNNNKKLSF